MGRGKGQGRAHLEVCEGLEAAGRGPLGDGGHVGEEPPHDDGLAPVVRRHAERLGAANEAGRAARTGKCSEEPSF